jgi:hypothetical protein
MSARARGEDSMSKLAANKYSLPTDADSVTELAADPPAAKAPAPGGCVAPKLFRQTV